MAYRFHTRDEAATRYVCVSDGDRPLTFDRAIAHWFADESFRTQLNAALRDCPHAAYFWETPPITAATLGRPFEFVMVDSPALARVSADPAAFRSHFASAIDGVASFDSLRGDARLVAPAPIGDPSAYPHLARFIRHAPPQQVHDLWRQVAAQVRMRLSNRPTWISTSGLGIYWLHVRLDSRPKYYSHRPYTIE